MSATLPNVYVDNTIKNAINDRFSESIILLLLVTKLKLKALEVLKKAENGHYSGKKT